MNDDYDSLWRDAAKHGRAGRLDEAATHWQRVLQIDPDNRPAKTFLIGLAPGESADGTR